MRDLIADLFERIGHTWKFKQGHFVPTAEDVQGVLDKAAVALYDCNIGDRFESGGLIIEKTEYGNRVYCYVGSYQ